MSLVARSSYAVSLAHTPTQELMHKARAKILPFGTKAHAFGVRHPQDDAPINILEGAVRSSKTWAMIPKLLSLSRYDVDGHRVLTGVSKQTIYNNVLSDLFEVLTPKNYNYNRQSGELDIMGCKWLVIGAKDEGSEKYVRGLTVGVAYGDELTLQPRSFVMMLLNRMSPANARFYATTNPDNPFHYVKTEIIDNQTYRKRGYIWNEHFTLDDNPNLTEMRKNYLRGLYTGVFHLRYIEGLWVVAEGAIYGGAWNEDDNTYDELPISVRGVESYVPVDCGVDHPQVYLDVRDDGDTLWVEREYYWDSKLTMKQKTDSQYADDLEEFLKDTNGAQVIIPPECASFEAELVTRGIWMTVAENAVADGIRTTASMMVKRKIKINRNRCPRLVKEIPAYSWDPKKSERGLEEPIKKNDDGCDALRYCVETKVNPWRIAA